MVPKKSSTNFWTVPFVDSSRVKKISGMDLEQIVIRIVVIKVVIAKCHRKVITIKVEIKITYLCERGMEASMEVRRWSGLTKW